MMENWVSALAYTPDGKTLAAGFGSRSHTGSAHNQVVQLVNPTTAKVKRTLTGFSGTIMGLEFLNAGQRLLVASQDRKLRLFETLSGALLGSWHQKSDPYSLAVSPDGNTLAVSYASGEIELRDAHQPSLPVRKTLYGHTSYVPSLAFSPDGALLASASWDQTVKLWSLTTGGELRSLRGHNDWVQSIAFSPDGNTLVSGGMAFALFWKAAIPSALARSERMLPRDALAAEAGGRWLEAIALLSRLVQRHPDDPLLRERRATAYAESGQFAHAAEDFYALLKLRGTGSVRTAVSLLLAKDNAAYRRLCQDMAARSLKNTQLFEAPNYAFVCTLVPDAVDDYAPLLRLTEDSSKVPALIHGVMLLHARQYEKALEVLERATDYPYLKPLWIACVQARLGHQELAQKAYQEAFGYRQQEETSWNWWQKALWKIYSREALRVVRLDSPELTGEVIAHRAPLLPAETNTVNLLPVSDLGSRRLGNTPVVLADRLQLTPGENYLIQFRA